ncbi:hypothetical protein PISL3812_01175 [Talaromyces islandicus]|uniref:Spindle pole body component n=1 Tax=Talaromyces islandicus TaxID=28573 RepID=A0A0U1LLB8_TALIS|nr:hypothetical protein PISL3812_01175 [Talaromyces islandicus]
MIHEILLSLSGQPSPLLDPELEPNGASSRSFPLLSPPEKELLGSLARLSRLHTLLRAHTARISSSHHSTICRAVSTAISTEHLRKFQNQILEVEKAVLGKDSGYVGGYGIVPLSTIVLEFAPWTRRLEWLWEVAQLILPESASNDPASTDTCSGASLIDYLRAESHTGYLDLQEIALQLIRAAEKAWMRQLSMWLLYGELPASGKEDFFVQVAEAELEDDENGSIKGSVEFAVHVELLPKFVSTATASSILFIGKSLNHIRSRRNRSAVDSASGSLTGITLEADHISHLSSLSSPISTSALSSAVTAIRLSVSQTSLSKLLPLPKIVEILSLIHDFLLLKRGEFAMALVSHADARLASRNQRPGHGPSGGLDSMIIKEGEVSAVLAQTWTELYALQGEEAVVDEELDLARDLLSLSIQPNKKGGCTTTPSRDAVNTNMAAEISSVSFDDLLFPTPTFLSLKLQPPIDLFLSSSDMSIYTIIHSYLLGIRRAQIRLSGLWKHTAMRRVHPTPWGPPRSNSRGGEFRLKTQRQRHNVRTIQMRPIWATTSASIFVLSEIGGYLQGEVIQESWRHFQDWLEGETTVTGSRPASRPVSRPGTASATKHVRQDSHKPVLRPSISQQGQPLLSQPYQQQQHDPETITVAHRRYLSSLVQYLFLTEVPFTSALRSFLTSIDHLVAIVSRLETVQRNLDLEADEGVVDALADYAQEEHSLWSELREARESAETGIKEIVSRLRDIDDSRSGEGRKMFDLSSSVAATATTTTTGPGEARDEYIPRKAAGVDRLLMKLDFAGLNYSGNGDGGEELVGDYDD